jgi:hypothetical protein
MFEFFKNQHMKLKYVFFGFFQAFGYDFLVKLHPVEELKRSDPPRFV